MKSNISLGKFRSEVCGYRNFILTYKDPLSPMSFSLEFDRIAVNISASPYIALCNKDSNFCISHVQSISKREIVEGIKSYVFSCNDFSTSSTPTPIKFTLKCC